MHEQHTHLEQGGPSPPGSRLRAAGLRVTSARVAALRVLPQVLARHGHVTPVLLWRQATQAGYTFHRLTFHGVIGDLLRAGLLTPDQVPATP